MPCEFPPPPSVFVPQWAEARVGFEPRLSDPQRLQRRDPEQLLCDGVPPGHRHAQRPLPQHGRVEGRRDGVSPVPEVFVTLIFSFSVPEKD